MTATEVGSRRNVAVAGLVGLLSFYRRFISPLFPPACRFTPSCSAYAVEAIRVHGALRGSWFALRRLLRCGPWHPGGEDPVPPRPVPGESGSAIGSDLKINSGVEE